jgi:glycine/D-amino acid oxidase-like deaminating enzyme
LSRLQLHPVKGQLVRVAPRTLPPDFRVVTGSGYIIPTPDGLIVGSSYAHEFDSTAPDRTVTDQLLTRATQTLPFLEGAAILSEHAGIRVTVPHTRMPMVGAVPGSRLVWMFSGLGSKGLLTAPMLGRALPAWFKRPETVPADLKIRLWRR